MKNKSKIIAAAAALAIFRTGCGNTPEASTSECVTTELASEVRTAALGNTVDHRMNMYNPMYYLDDYQDGYQSANVDFETVWGQGHVEAERTGSSTENFIAWVNECLK